jgi:carbon-monoxide dehydrogenase medium subunit/xanthine dehydrogenase FAD-binding subunit
MIANIEENVFEDLHFVPGAVTPYPIVFRRTQDAILNKCIDSIDFEEICSIACDEMLSITGERWSTEYKKHIIKCLVKRALETIIREARGE